MKVFVDSSIPMYVAGREHPLRERAVRFLERVRAGEVDACTSTQVLQEILYRYAGLKRLDLAERVYDLFVQLCPTVFAVTLSDTDRAKSDFVRGSSNRVRDAIHAAVMLNNGVHEIATFDTGFDDVEGIRRIDLP